MADIRLKKITVEPNQSPLVIQQGDIKILFLKSALLAINLSLVILGFIGMATASAHWRYAAPLYLIIIYKAIIHTLVFSCVRYQIPVMPYVLIFAVIGARRVMGYKAI